MAELVKNLLTLSMTLGKVYIVTYHPFLNKLKK